MRRFQRRDFVVVGCALLGAPLVAGAQQSSKVPRIGYLSLNSTPNLHLRDAFRQGLRDLGYVEGRNVVIEFRDAEGDYERLPSLARELVALNVDVIVTGGGTPTALAAKQATRTLAVVFASTGDPIADGLVANLARPGANVTGLSNLNPGLVAKCLQNVIQAVPDASQISVLWRPSDFTRRTARETLEAAEVAARALKVRLQFVEALEVPEIDRAFSKVAKARVDALTVWGSALFFTERKRIVDLAAKNRIPAIYPQREFVDAGGLMAYGPNLADLFRRAANYVDKILKGAKPGDLAIQQPTQFTLVINLKTAKELRLTMPQSLLARADEVIQ